MFEKKINSLDRIFAAVVTYAQNFRLVRPVLTQKGSMMGLDTLVQRGQITIAWMWKAT